MARAEARKPFRAAARRDEAGKGGEERVRRERGAGETRDRDVEPRGGGGRGARRAGRGSRGVVAPTALRDGGPRRRSARGARTTRGDAETRVEDRAGGAPRAADMARGNVARGIDSRRSMPRAAHVEDAVKARCDAPIDRPPAARHFTSCCSRVKQARLSPPFGHRSLSPRCARVRQLDGGGKTGSIGRAPRSAHTKNDLYANIVIIRTP